MVCLPILFGIFTLISSYGGKIFIVLKSTMVLEWFTNTGCYWVTLFSNLSKPRFHKQIAAGFVYISKRSQNYVELLKMVGY